MESKQEYLLAKYANHEGTEIGEYTTALLRLAGYTPDHGMSESFHAAVQSELIRLLEFFKEEFVFKERTVKKEYQVTELYHISEMEE